ncbi:rhodanese-related sulfurtransferase [Candidatus Nomurabacteria bacterium]|nr:rhodanese-related sulfurtransferase [Candidatus Nomurabacteria bacterium]
MHKELKNTLSRTEGMAKLAAESFDRVTVSFYKYVRLDNVHTLRDEIFARWDTLGVLGRIYLAEEGINAQCSVPEHHWDTFVADLYSIPAFKDIPFKIGVLQNPASFWKLIIKVKKQIVADGLTIEDYDIENVGTHLTAEEFNTALQDPDTIVVDMRNHYESEIGHFNGAWCPPVDTFREQLPMVAEELKEKKDKKVLLYCTGGIRCEKASAYLKHQGFEDVNQLHGGVIAYTHQVREKDLDCNFKGSNYVFDDRIRENISGEVISHCHQCGNTCDLHTNCINRACNLLFIQCSSCKEKMNNTCSKKCKKISLWPEEKQKAYVKKHGAMTQAKFSKSLQAKKMLGKKSPWEKLVGIFK